VEDIPSIVGKGLFEATSHSTFGLRLKKNTQVKEVFKFGAFGDNPTDRLFATGWINGEYWVFDPQASDPVPDLISDGPQWSSVQPAKFHDKQLHHFPQNCAVPCLNHSMSVGSKRDRNLSSTVSSLRLALQTLGAFPTDH
jgi:hypothetical protein